MRRLFGTPPAHGSLEKQLLDRYIRPLAQWLGASNSCINPFVYCYFSHRVKGQELGLGLSGMSMRSV